MKYGQIQDFQTGVAIPLSGIKTHQSSGIGEYPDLLLFAEWAKKSGMDLIQLLPINDTGFSASPYSALSAFALNPVYLNMDSLPGVEPFLSEIRIFREQMSHCESIPYPRVYDFKLRILRQIYQQDAPQILKNRKLQSWVKNNSWVVDYSVYATLKEKHGQNAWFHWPENQSMTGEERALFFKENKSQTYFYVWTQWLIELQWSAIVAKISALGVKIKGDIPILINEDSADVWAHPQLFNTSSKAGAPPDMFSKSGQNWGFPCYDWEELAKTNYLWWRERIQQCNKFFHAIRIDHVLGFFRIWKIPSSENAGILGQFDPSVGITEALLGQYQLSHLSKRRFTHPHFHWHQLEEIFQGLQYDWRFLFEESEGFFWLKEEYCNEKKLIELAGNWKDLKKSLLRCYWNRLLISYQNDYTPYWYWYNSESFHSLSEDEKRRFSDLVHQNEASQDSLWYREGKRILSMMKEETDMLVCAEDLGAVPACVPRVLEELDILGLKIERWAKEWGTEGEPFISPKHYPRNSVCTPSCHDTSTLRGWWDEKTWDHRQYLGELGWAEDPDFLTVELCEAILTRNLLSNSLITIFPLQDWLSLSYNLRTFSSDEERINVPGTVNETNWNWKMKPFLEDLLKEDWIQGKIFDLIAQRKNRPL